MYLFLFLIILVVCLRDFIFCSLIVIRIFLVIILVEYVGEFIIMVFIIMVFFSLFLLIFLFKVRLNEILLFLRLILICKVYIYK